MEASDRSKPVAERRELARVTLSVLFIGGLIAGSLWILAPFLGAFIWATMIVVATWPLLLRAERVFGGRRWMATAVMTLALLALLIVPLFAAIVTIMEQAGDVAGLRARIETMQVPPAPGWLERAPVVGERAATAWNQVAAGGPTELVTRIEPYFRTVGRWIAQQAGSFAVLVLQFLLVVVLSAVLYSGGETWGAWLRRFGGRLADEQGERMVVLAGQAIRGVALGVVLTALIQTVLSGIGLAIVGVPFASVLTAFIFMLCIAQLGPLFVMVPAIAWTYLQLGAGWGTFMLVWGLVVGLMDNFLRPVLIRRGADLPLLLIFAGVIGGLVAFGVVGIFVGPVILAVAYRLLDDWVKGRGETQGDVGVGSGT